MLPNKVQSSSLFNLLQAMEGNLTDNLKILDLVKTQNSDSTVTTSSSLSSNINPNTANSYMQTNSNIGDNNNNTNNNIADKPNQSLNSHLFSHANQNTFSSPASLLTNAGSPAAVLAVSGISATNLLITSSGALGISQIANLTAAANTNLMNSINGNNSGPGLLNNPNSDTNSNLIGLGSNETQHGSGSLQSPLGNLNLSSKTSDGYRNGIRALDFCYSDDQNIKFNIIDSINLCVTVVAYATHAYRANQMLTILDVIIPRYFIYLKQETDAVINQNKSNGFAFMSQMDRQSNSHYQMEIIQKARYEFLQLQKISVSIKTLVNSSDFLTRAYTGPRSENSNNAAKSSQNQNKNTNNSNRSPSIMPDEDSMRFPEERRSKQPDQVDDSLIKQEFRLPRDTLLNIVSEFVYFSSKRVKELYKIINDPSLKVSELLDIKAHCKLVEIAHTLLKLWDDSITLNGNGLQKYFFFVNII